MLCLISPICQSCRVQGLSSRSWHSSPSPSLIIWYTARVLQSSRLTSSLQTPKRVLKSVVLLMRSVLRAAALDRTSARVEEVAYPRLAYSSNAPFTKMESCSVYTAISPRHRRRTMSSEDSRRALERARYLPRTSAPMTRFVAFIFFRLSSQLQLSNVSY